MTPRPDEILARSTWPWRAGQIAQGLVLGVLLFIAVLGLIALSGSVTVFRYQGY